MAYVRSLVLEFAEAALHGNPLATRRAVSAACGVSPATLSRAINTAQGESFREWRRRVVVARAERMLQQRSRPLSMKEIAGDLGFRTPSSFARWFHKHTGLTPSAYRGQHDTMLTAGDRGSPEVGTPLAGGGVPGRRAARSTARGREGDV